MKNNLLLALAALCLVPTVSNVQGVEANANVQGVEPNAYNNAVAELAINQISRLLAANTHGDNIDGTQIATEIANIFCLLDPEIKPLVARNILERMKHTILPYFNKIGVMYPAFLDIPDLSSEDIMFLVEFYKAHNQMEGKPLENIIDKAFHNNTIREEYIKAIYELRKAIKLHAPLKYAILKGMLTTGLEYSSELLLRREQAKLELTQDRSRYPNTLAAANEVLQKYNSTSLPFTLDRMRNWGENEELPKIEGISPEDQTTMNRVLDEAEGIKWSIKEHNEAQRELVQIMRLQKDLSKKLQSKNSKNLAEEIMKYAFPANELCRKFEKILDLEKAREFFIDLGVLRNKIIDTRAPELQNVQPLAAPLMNHFMEEEEHKD